MQKVVSLNEWRQREHLAMLGYLTRLAKKGELEGLAIVFRRDGRDEYAFTGIFNSDSAAALKAANRISWKMNQALDAREADAP